MSVKEFLKLWQRFVSHYREVCNANGMRLIVQDEDFVMCCKLDGSNDLAFVSELILAPDGKETWATLNVWKMRIDNMKKGFCQEAVPLPYPPGVKSSDIKRVSATIFFPLRELREDEDMLSLLSDLTFQHPGILGVEE